jgi:hypothetical protein
MMTLVLNMSALQACKVLLAANEEVSLTDVEILIKNDPTLAHLDWENAGKWRLALLSRIGESNLPILLREACVIFISSNSLLSKLLLNGREPLVQSLSTDERQVFENAGLLAKLPSKEIIEWWDLLRQSARNTLNASLADQGRKAEQWTIDYETEYLKKHEPNLLPDWLSLESDYYGYDIRSFRFSHSSKYHSILIEVKSFSRADYPHFYVSEKEWEKAKESTPNYFFHVWCIETKELRILSVEDVSKNIPANVGSGRWQNILVSFDWL